MRNDTQRAGSKQQIPNKKTVESRVVSQTVGLKQKNKDQEWRERQKVRQFDRRQQEKIKTRKEPQQDSPDLM